MSNKNQKNNMRKVALTALAGTSIEWYDFFLYGAAAALIFPTAFFGETTPNTALILSLLTFAAGFIARPIGGIVFGHYGDRVGRKKTLVMALILMGVSSTLIGLLPTYAMIGVTAPILLTSLRFAQGLAIGGQWGGAMLLVTESAPSNQRGYYGAFAQAGAPVGVILANLAFIVTSSLVSEESFYSWGWRIPFLASAVLIAISMYIQLNLEDTKAFKELKLFTAHPEATLALANGTCDAQTQTVPNLAVVAKKQKGVFELVGPITDKTYMAWVTRPEDTDLRDYISSKILEMRDSGKIDAIQDKWFGFRMPIPSDGHLPEGAL